MEAWRMESQPGKQSALAWGSAAVGLTLLWAFRHLDGPGYSNTLAGFLLGLLLLGLGAWALLAAGKQVVVVDPARHRILVQDTHRFGSKAKTIPFEAIGTVTLGYLGTRSNAVSFYYLLLHLSDGRRVPLFSPGRFFAGSTDRAVVEGWRQRLQAMLESGSRPPVQDHPPYS